MPSAPPFTRGLFRPFGRLRWPWRFVTTMPAQRAPLVCLNRYPRQVIGIHFRLPDGVMASGGTRHFGLSILWARPDVRAYPASEDGSYFKRRQGWR